VTCVWILCCLATPHKIWMSSSGYVWSMPAVLATLQTSSHLILCCGPKVHLCIFCLVFLPLVRLFFLCPGQFFIPHFHLWTADSLFSRSISNVPEHCCWSLCFCSFVLHPLVYVISISFLHCFYLSVYSDKHLPSDFAWLFGFAGLWSLCSSMTFCVLPEFFCLISAC